MQTITEYYESYDEDSRLRDSKAKQTEFITTTIFLDRYLVKGDRKFLTEDWANRIVDKGFTSSEEEDCFWTDAYFHTAEEISQLMEDYGTEMVEHVATDGLASLMGDLINDLSDEEYEAWLNYHLKTCSQPSVLGATNHALYICRKIAEPRGE